MLKESIKIGKDYFKLISIKNKYLILFIICYIISMTINLIIPIFTSLIIEYITKDLYKETLKVISLLSISYLLHELFSYGIYHYYAIFFKNTYINIHQRIINSIYQLDEEFGKKLSSGKIINSSNIDIINISEISSDIFDIIIGLIKLIIILCIFLKQNIFLGIYILIINTIYTYYSYSCNKKSANYSKKQRKYADELTSLTSQVLTGLKDVKSYNMGEKLNKRFKDFRKNWGKNYYLKRKYYFTQKTLITLIIKFGKIIIGSNCFIGARSIILPNVTIGDKSIIAAGSVVTKCVPSGEVWGGNPARYIMKADEYAKHCLEKSPIYDAINLQKNKKEEVLKILSNK